MSRSKHNGCGRGGGCGLCRPHKKWKSNSLKNEKSAVQRELQKGREQR